jgi:hypothetical protein
VQVVFRDTLLMQFLGMYLQPVKEIQVKFLQYNVFGPQSVGKKLQPLTGSQPVLLTQTSGLSQRLLNGVFLQPVASIHSSMVHETPSSQSVSTKSHPPVKLLQVPTRQSVLAHVTGVLTHPVAGLQESMVHLMLSSQLIWENSHVPVEPLQIAVEHKSGGVQRVSVYTHWLLTHDDTLHLLVGITHVETEGHVPVVVLQTG